ncbi:MAG: SH3 domain-containing protein [Bacteroidota bacterium]
MAHIYPKMERFVPRYGIYKLVMCNATKTVTRHKNRITLKRIFIHFLLLLSTTAFGQDEARVIKIADLNGDGIDDTITLSFIDERGMAMRYNLRVNNIEISGDAVILVPMFKIIDIDTKDNFKEIAIYEEGPSSDEATTLYYFNGKQIILMGKVGNYIGKEEWNKVKGDGIITATARGQILQTWAYPDDYKLNSKHLLENIPKDLYPMNSFVTVKKEITLQKSRTDATKSITLKVGEKITIASSDNYRWCLVKNSKDELGWFEVANYDKIVELGIEAREVFEGLSYAD